MKFTPEELKYQADRFFEIDLDAKDRPVSQRSKVRTLNTLRLWLGITFEEWKEYCSLLPYENVIDEIKTRLQIWLEEKLLFDNKPVGAIFALKAQYGWTDTPQANSNVHNYVYVFGNEKNQLTSQGKQIIDATIIKPALGMDGILNRSKGRPLGSKARKKFTRKKESKKKE